MIITLKNGTTIKDVARIVTFTEPGDERLICFNSEGKEIPPDHRVGDIEYFYDGEARSHHRKEDT